MMIDGEVNNIADGFFIEGDGGLCGASLDLARLGEYRRAPVKSPVICRVHCFKGNFFAQSVRMRLKIFKLIKIHMADI
jgi:hypothetical protein